METTKTASQILLDAANLLEEEGRWGKGSYFKFTDEGCLMCAHGAIAYCGRQEVKDRVINNNLPHPFVTASPLIAAIARADVIAQREAIQAWSTFEGGEIVSIEDYIRKYYCGETGLAHYRAAQVGLTFNYNDSKDTTQQDVVNKLREAAKLS